MVLIIAEGGVNHNGSLAMAKKLVEAAKMCGADIIKFQFFECINLVTPSAKKANYQISKSEETQLEMLRKLQLNFEDHIHLKEFCEEKKIEFLSSGFDLKSLDLLKKLNLKRYKIPSGEITNLPYLRMVGQQNKPIILSTGMSSMDEIEMALNQLYMAGAKKDDLTILHCTTEYPAPLHDVNLRAMNSIKNKFDIKVGYSDHTLGIEVSLAAVAMGADIIEKHLTLDNSQDGPDHKASLEPDQFKNLVKGIRNISLSLGSGEKKIRDSELKNISKVRKSIIAKKSIKKNELFTEKNLCAKRPGTGLSPMLWDEIIGTRATRNYKIDDFIRLD